ncbi:hypothetical protein DK412_16655 [Methylobacterium sp. 17Sr1-1]|nr:hypothetical protein DK412_16655 [Methylobacterium sp. 17Sr1-1]
MSGIGQAPGGTWARWRGVAAVLSLYGLVLQAFLAGLAPAPVTAGAGLLCQSHRAPADQIPSGKAPLVHAHACCTVACQAYPAPPAPAMAAAWPPRMAVVLFWSVAAADPARAAPARPASARGPPAA